MKAFLLAMQVTVDNYCKLDYDNFTTIFYLISSQLDVVNTPNT